MPSVAGIPTGIVVSRNGYDCISVSWTAPSTGALPAGYEVFYLTEVDNIVSGGNTSNTKLTLTGLMLARYSTFVVSYGAEGEPLLPSAHSQTACNIRYNW